MKLYNITHETTYKFSDPVELLPHVLRLRPREGHELRIESSALNIYPSAALRWYRDVEGNCIAIASFEGKTQVLNINSEIVIQKYDLNPYDFLIADYALDYPFSYPEEDKNQYIFQTFQYNKREEEGVQTAEHTIAGASGSCRDFANLFIVVSRSLGFAARFVSGYIFSGFCPNQSGSTHAWAEVFVPGAGWKGFDPTFGAIVGAEHVATTVARRPEQVPPVSGSFYGKPGSSMTVDVCVTEIV